MYIKGFDEDLKCRDYQFEIGKEFKIDSAKKLELCTDTVFHFCDNLRYVHAHYTVLGTNRFCEIEVLGEVIKDDNKYGSNHIKIIREITGNELDLLKNTGNRNTGYWNSGNSNSGDYNSGSRNSGDWNTGDWNSRNSNSGDWNSGYWNTGNWNTGDWNTGNWNTGYCNTGNWNTGSRNSGNRNFGDWNSGNRNSGSRNSGDWNFGDWNSGNRNSGSRNSGDWNSGDNANGFFCNKEPKICIFNIQSEFTLREFKETKYYRALCSKTLELTEWIEYTEEEKINDEVKSTLGGFLKTYTYKEACSNWWELLTEENKEIILSIPNFNRDVFFEITGIE